MSFDSPPPPPQSSVWIWASADGVRWRINYSLEGVWSCPIGLGGKRVGAWKAGLPPSLGNWPDMPHQQLFLPET